MILPLQNKRQDLLLESPLGSIALELTTRCNLHCKMCGFRKGQKIDPPYEKVLSLLDEAYELGARRFDPWGTELFMRNDIVDILAYAERIGFREIYVVSNGILLNRPKLFDNLSKLKYLVLIVSLDGPEAIHDEIRGNGVYQQAVSSLRNLGQSDIKRSISSIIMRPTIDHLHKIVDLAADLNIAVISMQPYGRDIAGPDCDHTMFEFRPDEKQIVEKKLKGLLKYARQKNVIIYTGNMMKHVASYLAEGVNPFPPHGCHVPSKTLVVDIEGNTHPCFVINKNMGNVNEISLSSIWHSDIHNQFILSALEKKCPGCLRACSDVESYNTGMKNKFHHVTDLTARQLVLYIKKQFVSMKGI
jgi:MoaA/NifB/PqqE/SkfB family radical SAM enzyme